MSTPDIPVLTKVINKSKNSETSESLNTANLVAQVKLALLPELKTIILEHLLKPDSDANVEGSLIDKLTKEFSASVSQEISDKISGIQELAVNQARTQIGNSMVTIEEGFKEALQIYAKQQEGVLAEFFDQQAQQTKMQMAEKAKGMSDQLLDTVIAYSQKLTEEGKAKLVAEQEKLQISMLDKSKQAMDINFAEIAKSQRQLFTEQLTAKLPEFEQALSEKIKVMVADEMQHHMKAIEAELTSKLKLNIVEVLQGIKFVFPNGNANSSTSAGGQ